LFTFTKLETVPETVLFELNVDVCETILLEIGILSGPPPASDANDPDSVATTSEPLSSNVMTRPAEAGTAVAIAAARLTIKEGRDRYVFMSTLHAWNR
jgi:hypothetical protein